MSAQELHRETDSGWSEVYDAIVRELAFDALREARDAVPGARARGRGSAARGPEGVPNTVLRPAL